MDRRNFLSLAALAVAAKTAGRVFPFRVFSIPKDIVVARPEDIPTVQLVRHFADATYYVVESRSGVVQGSFMAPSYLPPNDAFRWAVNNKFMPRVEHPALIKTLLVPSPV